MHFLCKHEAGIRPKLDMKWCRPDTLVNQLVTNSATSGADMEFNVRSKNYKCIEYTLKILALSQYFTNPTVSLSHIHTVIPSGPIK